MFLFEIKKPTISITINCWSVALLALNSPSAQLKRISHRFPNFNDCYNFILMFLFQIKKQQLTYY